MKKPAFVFCCLALAILFVCGFARGQMIFDVTDDSYVRGGIYANDNYNVWPGGEAGDALRARAGQRDTLWRRTYLRFDVSAYSEPIAKATLTLWLDRAVNTLYMRDTASFYAANDNWTEESITWNNAPPPAQFLFTQVFARRTSSMPDTFYTWDVTPYVQGELGGDGLVTFVVMDPVLTNHTDLRFFSKETFGKGATLELIGTTVTSIASGDWNAGTTWNQAFPPLPTQDVIISHAVTLTAPDTAKSVTVNAGGVLDIAAFRLGLAGTYTLAAGAEGRQSGYVLVPGGGTTRWSFDPASTFTIYGASTGFMITGAPGITLGNVNWNSSSNATPPVGTVIAGNLTLGGTGQLRCGTSAMTPPPGPTDRSRTISVLGNVVVNSGVLVTSNSDYPITGALDVSGNITINSLGTLRGVNRTGEGTIFLSGNLINNSGTIEVGDGAGDTGNWTIRFRGSNSATFDPGVTNAFRNIIIEPGKTVNLLGSLAVNSTYTFTNNGTLNCGTSVIGGAGNFSLLPGASLECGHADGINGNIAVTGGIALNTEANYAFSGLAAQITGSLLPASVNNLTIANTSGVTLGTVTAVNGTLALMGGNVTTGENTLVIGPSGVVNRTLGHVVGNLRKQVSSASMSKTFEIGDAGAYTPVDISFNNVIQPGYITARTTGMEHPQIATSRIDASKSANRYYTLVNSGVGFDAYSAVFNFVSSDIDPSANPNNFVAGVYDGATWSAAPAGVRTPTSTQITGVTFFGDVAFGEQKNTPPTLTDVPSSAEIDELALLTFDAGATDPEAPPQTLTFSLENQPDGATIDPTTGVLQWTPTEAQGPGTYEFLVKVTDGVAWAMASAAVTVREVNMPPVLGNITAPIEPMQVDLTLSAIAPFYDYDIPIGTHTAVWDWGDNTTSDGAVTYTEPTGGTVTGEHAYEAAGVYTITLTLRDNDGAEAQAIYSYIVVFDPEGGFVTGGGWIMSPPDAYSGDPELTGKATFGFVAKYQRGSTVPAGNTEFQFRVAELNFKSTSYQWLVIAGPKAKYKGSGTINGRGNYGFLLTAIDGQITGGGGVDKFRIKIWDVNTAGRVVYDNQPGEDDASDAATEIGGGAIVIHRPGSPLARTEPERVIPTEFALAQNYPNPFNPVTTVQFDLPSPSVVTLTVYDCAGREVATLVRGRAMETGRYTMNFDGSTCASGLYFCRMRAEEIAGQNQAESPKRFAAVKSMLLVK